MYADGRVSIEVDGDERFTTYAVIEAIRKTSDSVDERHKLARKVWESLPPIHPNEDGGCNAKCGMTPHRGPL